MGGVSGLPPVLFVIYNGQTYEGKTVASDQTILDDFQAEARRLLVELHEVLKLSRPGFSHRQTMGEFGQKVDRIMGAARTLPLNLSGEFQVLDQVSEYTSICKDLGYRCSQLDDNPQLYETTLQLLTEAIEILDQIFQVSFFSSSKKAAAILTSAKINKLKLVLTLFNREASGQDRASVAGAEKLNQKQIDQLLKKLGMD